MFLKYLLNEKHVDRDQLLMAVIEQLESMPSLLRVLVEDDVLDKEKATEFLFMALEQKKGLATIVKEESGLTPTDIEEAVKRQNCQGKGIGEILVAQGVLEQGQFNEIVKAYESAPKEEISTSEESSPVEASKNEEPAANVSISAAALESLKAVTNIDDSEMANLEEKVSTEVPKSEVSVETTTQENGKEEGIAVSEYLDFYNDAFQSELFVTANRFYLKGREKDLHRIHEAFTRILSLAKLNSFEYHIKLLEPLDEYLSTLMNGKIDISQDDRKFPFEALELLWPMRNMIAGGQSEVLSLNDEAQKQVFIETIKRLMIFLKRTT